MSSDSERRKKYIREHYSLRQLEYGEWVATSTHGGSCPTTKVRWTTEEKYFGASREEVARAARCEWGHFNFDDEAIEFGKIFSV
jgi:hypothetical protein